MGSQAVLMGDAGMGEGWGVSEGKPRGSRASWGCQGVLAVVPPTMSRVQRESLVRPGPQPQAVGS